MFVGKVLACTYIWYSRKTDIERCLFFCVLYYFTCLTSRIKHRRYNGGIDFQVLYKAASYIGKKCFFQRVHLKIIPVKQ